MPYEIDDTSKAILLTLTGRTDDQEVAFEVEEAYWKFMRVYNHGFSGRPIEASALTYMAMHDPVFKKKDAPVESSAKNSEMKRDDIVGVRWRGKKRTAKFLSMSADKKFANVILEGDEEAEERSIKAENVLVGTE